MKELKFNVTTDEANLILSGLGKLPFENVYDLINKLQNQAKNQLQVPENEQNDVGEEKINLTKQT